MKKTFKNFKKLSAKQIKTYAALLLMATFSFDAIASANEENVNSESGMISLSEESFEEELFIESWMLSPFEASIEAETAMEMPLPTLSEEVIEIELALESWMTVPFETNFVEEMHIEDSICIPAP